MSVTSAPLRNVNGTLKIKRQEKSPFTPEKMASYFPMITSIGMNLLYIGYVMK